EVKIPAGVTDGARIRMAGQGTRGPGGRGDLYLRVHVRPDPQFTREGTTLRTRVDVPLTTALLGGQVLVPTPDGRRLALRVPAETANGKAFRLRGQGMPTLGPSEKHGDLYADVHVVLPTHLNAQQRRLFEAFAEALNTTSQEAGREEGVHG
ncbi:MAG TPA: DnaJ C-terminal domain-containing protein, partial [Ktedonobacteraceae bacterium]